jgi:homoserine dehydrogenase
VDVNIGLLGCGTVGEGVVELTRRRTDKILGMTGLKPIIRSILVRDLAKPRGVSFQGERLTTNVNEILNDQEIQVVVETIGGIEPARTIILQAIRSGKHVVTANKDLIALHGAEILSTAEEFHVNVLYEAAVGGAIPLVGPLKDNLTANEVTDLKGIINGTTNFILTKMTDTGADFDDALKEAQELGFAESDPSSDIDGLDAARKLVILASIGFHARVQLSQVKVKGIRSISARDVSYASELGSVIKLLAVGSDRDGTISLRVTPTLIPKAHPLAHVSGSYNALFVRGDAAGDLMFSGRGAGSLPTASAVVGDIIGLLRNIKLGASARAGRLLMDKKIAEQSTDSLQHYLRITVADEPGVFARIAALFADADVSMETVLQKRVSNKLAEIVVVTHEIPVHHAESLALRLQELSHVQQVHTLMPVEPFAD